MEEDDLKAANGMGPIHYVDDKGKLCRMVYSRANDGMMSCTFETVPTQGEIVIPANGEANVLWTPDQPSHWKDEKEALEDRISDLERQLEYQKLINAVSTSNVLEAQKRVNQLQVENDILHHALIMSLMFSTVSTIDHDIETRRVKDMELTPEQTTHQRNKIVENVFKVCYEDLNRIINIEARSATIRCRDILALITTKVQDRLRSKGSLKEVFNDMSVSGSMFNPYRMRIWTNELCGNTSDPLTPDALAQSIADSIVYSVLKKLANYV